MVAAATDHADCADAPMGTRTAAHRIVRRRSQSLLPIALSAKRRRPGGRKASSP